MSTASTVFRLHRQVRLVALGIGASAALCAGSAAHAQSDVTAGPRTAATGAGTLAPSTTPSRASSKPAWADLGTRQQAALAPLAPHWTGLSESQKLKWIALSRNFDRLGDGEQAKLHDRMIDWAGLSVQQRTQARLNFAETSKLAPDDKKARWEAYQALSEEQRSKLATTSTSTRPPGGATALKPVVPQRLTQLPPSTDAQRTRPRLGVPATEVDHNTLLPQHPVVAPGSAASR